jgi:hypothetical protein
MKTTLRRRVEALEEKWRVNPVRLIRYGWFTPLPPNWEGERHVVAIRQEASNSNLVEWYEWEERIGPALIATGAGT